MKLLTLVIVAFALAACTGDDPNLTDAGKGKPLVTVEFPERVEPGDEVEAALVVTNPGPGDMRTVAVAFATIGPTPGAQEFPGPLVGVGSGGENPSILAVSPEPTGVSPDAVVFTFGPVDGAPRLPEGASLEIVFTIRAPSIAGDAANSVQVYDGQEIDRAAGVRLQTSVGR